MTDDQLIAAANDCLDSGKAMGIQFMRDALTAYRRKYEKQLVTGLEKLSDRQAEAYEYIKRYIEVRGHAPSVREIAEAMGLKSSSTAQGIMNKLFNKGYLKRIGPRAIEIIGKREG